MDIFFVIFKKELDLNTDSHALDSEIEQLSYELFGLTADEIKIVEKW